MEILFEIVIEFLFYVGSEILGELVLGTPFRPKRSVHPVFAYSAIVFVGVLAGTFLFVVVPEPLLPTPRIPGLSLIVTPLAAGAAMHYFGRWRRGRGREPTWLASFWGGALFAFSTSMARFLAVHTF